MQVKIRRIISAIMLQPARDYFFALDSCIHGSYLLNSILIFLFLLFSWWIYVPVHELFHALGCFIGGGNVSRLELSPIYGAAVLKKIFPFISVGSAYAGQLKEFDTFGSDSGYLLTVFFPYILTVIVGLPLLKSVSPGSKSPHLLNCIKFGIAIPFAYAPFISVTGDYYEMGSIIISKSVSLVFHGFEPHYWRSDDLIALVRSLFFSGHSVKIEDIAGLSAGFLLGIALIYATYWLGILFSTLVQNGAAKKRIL